MIHIITQNMHTVLAKLGSAPNCSSILIAPTWPLLLAQSRSERGNWMMKQQCQHARKSKERAAITNIIHKVRINASLQKDLQCADIPHTSGGSRGNANVLLMREMSVTLDSKRNRILAHCHSHVIRPSPPTHSKATRPLSSIHRAPQRKAWCRYGDESG